LVVLYSTISNKVRFMGHEVEMIDMSINGEVSMNASSNVRIDKAHREGLPHRGVWMLLVRAASGAGAGGCELLVVQRSAQSKTCPGLWAFPGEHTRLRESYRAAALRGVWEEFGLAEYDLLLVQALWSGLPVLQHIQYLGPVARRRVDVQWVVPFVLVLRPNSRLKVNQESSAARWLDGEALRQWARRCRQGEGEKAAAGAGSGALDCHACPVLSFSITADPGAGDRGAVVQTSFEEVLADLTRGALGFMARHSHSRGFCNATRGLLRTHLP
jgi:8-oxo-dGTP pyrophosphatase MutT (NUDIX family)